MIISCDIEGCQVFMYGKSVSESVSDSLGIFWAVTVVVINVGARSYQYICKYVQM